jgi:hypothetical protein
MDVTNRLTGGPGAQGEEEQKKQAKPMGSTAITDFFFNNMKMIKSKLEKKKREQQCKLSKDQIKALKEFRQQQREFPFKVDISDIEEQVKYLGLYK